MQKQKRRVVIQWIKKVLVPQLPAETYKAYHKYHEPRMEKDEEGKDVWRMGYLGDHNVNHGRRIINIYDKYGFQGIQGYLNFYGLQLSNK